MNYKKMVKNLTKRRNSRGKKSSSRSGRPRGKTMKAFVPISVRNKKTGQKVQVLVPVKLRVKKQR